MFLYKSSIPVNTSCFKLIIFCHAVYLCSLRSSPLNIVHSLNRILIPFVCIHKILKRHIFQNLLNTIIDSINDQMLNCFLISTFLFLFAEFNILSYKEDRKIGFTLIFALICAVAIYALFKYAFSMPLPQGILKGIF